MSIPSRQIGWSQESNLLWGIWNDLSKVSRAVNCCNGTASNPTNVVLPGVTYDAFGRQRVSEPFTLFDSSHRFDDNDLWSTETSSGGTAVFNANQGLIDLNVTAASGSSVTRETVKVFPYQPGKSLLVMNTFVMSAPKAGLTQRVGYYGDDNGFYLEQANSDIAFIERSIVSGSLVNTPVPQSEWNGDKLDGTGASKLTLDLTKAQIYWMDLEWLGVGSVRMGFVINGQFQLIENATIANASFSNVAGSVVQSAIHTDTITDGTVVYAGLNSSRDEVEIGEDIKKRLQLWRYANGTPSTLTLAVAYTATNADLLYKFGWEELTN